MFENIEVHFCKWLHIYDNLHSVYTMNSSQILRQQTKLYTRSTKDINLKYQLKISNQIACRDQHDLKTCKIWIPIFITVTEVLLPGIC